MVVWFVQTFSTQSLTSSLIYTLNNIILAVKCFFVIKNYYVITIQLGQCKQKKHTDCGCYAWFALFGWSRVVMVGWIISFTVLSTYLGKSHDFMFNWFNAIKVLRVLRRWSNCSSHQLYSKIAGKCSLANQNTYNSLSIYTMSITLHK